MDFLLNNTAGIIYLLSPLIALINAYATGHIVGWAFIFLKPSILTRLIKVICVPIAFIVYIWFYYQNYFDFEIWMESIFLSGSEVAFPPAARAFLIIPVPLAVFVSVVSYVLGWPKHEEEEEVEVEVEEEH